MCGSKVMANKGGVRRLLLVNGNTNAALTDRLVERARVALPPERDIIGATAIYGPGYISARADAVVAARAIVDTIALEVKEYGAENISVCLLACFGEPGIGAAREIYPFPVVGMAEASILSAMQLGERFAIVTVGERWPSMLRELMRQQRLDDRCCATLAINGHALEVAASAEGARRKVAELISEAREQHGADVIIVGGAALAGVANDLQPEFDVPLICSFSAGLAQAEALASLREPVRH
ncbi:hypothetical protein QV13_20810 [Mesorhizobium hungaricum]|uniref:Hydrogenase expression protein HupH n=2 Tax=Hyphomicrobiales TaxID=356 RepID=A0A1C2DJA1_9HYPH|nr:hypothetical protein QV13_20810 [Mesorhizobium hungaricum]